MFELEQEIISRLLYKPDDIHHIEIEPHWFHAKKHKQVIAALAANNGKPIDVTTFCGYIRDADPHTEITESYLDGLQVDGFGVDNLKDKAKALKYFFYKMRLEIASKKFGQTPSRENMLNLQDNMRELEKLDQPEDDGNLSKTVEEILRQMEEGNGEGILTYPMVDDTLGGGMHGGTLIVIGARPGVGKTAYGINLSCQAMIKQRDILTDFFTLEMSKEQMLKRFLSRMTEINSYKLRNPKLQLSSDEKAMIVAKSMEILDTHLRIHDKLFNIKQIEKQIRRRHHEANGRPYIAFIDYLGLVDSGNNQQPRHVQIGEITRTLKILTNELDIPIVLFSQLNRGIESRSDKKPNLADLRESGSVEQDANVVMFLYQDSEDENKTIVDVAKNREGFTGEIPYRFLKSKMYFMELSE